VSVIDEIKGKLDIVELVSSYVPLKKAGRTFKAPCPFHSERTPSFVVDPARQSWHCFGACSEGGDVFSFVMKKEGVEFGEALQLLAQRAGVELVTQQAAEGPDERERLRQAHEAAALYYHNLLLNSGAGEEARRYLLEQRRLTAKSIQDFQLGFSLDSWSGLKAHLLERGYGEVELILAGLLRRRDDGSGSYDAFRGRIMFPIWDQRGHAIGFGSRALTAEQAPKYLNSPQTPLFDKSGTLYPIHRARQAIRREDRAVIVEGYLDAIMAHQHGLENVVASLGTALTEQQVGLLKGLTKRIVFALDPDAAGDHATLRGIEVASEALDHKTVPVPTSRGLIRYERILDAEIQVAALPPGKDPDEIIAEDPGAWRRLVEGAQPVTDYLFQAAAARHDLAQVEERATLVKELLPAVAELKDPVRRAHYLQRLAKLGQVQEEALQAELRPAPRGRSSARDGVAPTRGPAPPREPLEEHLLAFIIQYPELRSLTVGLAPSAFERWENRACFEALCQGPSLEATPPAMPPGLGEHWERLRLAELPPTGVEHRERAVADGVRRLKERALRRHWAQSGQILADAYTELRADPAPGEAVAEHLRLFEQGAASANELGRLQHQQQRGPESEGEQRDAKPGE